MNINWIPTNDYYRELVSINDLAQRTARYETLFIDPWRPMMRMLGQDGLAGARQWAWYLPEDLNQLPDILHELEAANTWTQSQAALQRAVAAFDDLPFDTVEGWIALGKPDRHQQGYSGSIDWTAPRFVCQISDPKHIRSLPGGAAHEFNHLVRLRWFPWDMQNTSVGDYIIHEGVAEAFATEICGADVLGYYVTDISENELRTAAKLIQPALERTGFDVIRGYIFGDRIAERMQFDQVGMPDFGGYAVGYHVVQAFLQRTGCSAAEATALPAQQIIQESGYWS